MPDNRSIMIYRKGQPEPEKLVVKSVENPHTSGLPKQLVFQTEDNRPGTIYLNWEGIEAVVVSPTGIPDQSIRAG